MTAEVAGSDDFSIFVLVDVFVHSEYGSKLRRINPKELSLLTVKISTSTP